MKNSFSFSVRLFAISISMLSIFALISPSHPYVPGSIIHETLPNGLELLILENHSYPVVCVNAVVKVGSVWEEDKIGCGLSHYAEHVVSGGTTSKRTEAETQALLQSIGKVSNASTSKDRTSYFITTSSDNFAIAFDIIADTLQNCSLETSEVEREKGVIIQEIKKCNDEPSRMIYDLLSSTMFMTHPQRHPIIGYMENFSGLTREDMVRFYKKFYVPNNTVIAVVGDVNAEEVIKLARETFKDWKRQPLFKLVLPAEPPQAAYRFAEKAMDTGGPTRCLMAMGWHSVRLEDPDMYPLDLLAVILARGESSRLVKRIKDELRLVNSISAGNYTPSFGTGAFTVHCELDISNVRTAEAEIKKVIYEAISKGVTKEEVNRAITQLEAERKFSLEEIQAQAEDIAENFASTGDPYYGDTYLEKIKKVTPEDISRAAKKYLFDENLTTAVIRPIGSSPLSYTGSSSVRKDDTVTKHVLPCGMTLLLKEDPNSDLVAFRVCMKGGVITETAENNGITFFMANLLTKGTRTKNARKIAEIVDRMGARLSAESGDHSFSIGLEVMDRDFDKGLELIADIVMNSIFPEEEVEKFRVIMNSLVDREKGTWEMEAIKFARSVFFKDHPYSRTRFGTKESIAKITRDMIVEYYRKHSAPAGTVLAIFGKIDRDDAIKKVESLFKNFSGKMEAETFQDPPFLSETREETTISDKKQVVITISFPGTTLASEDRYVLDVIDAAISGVMYPSGWLHEGLRGGKESLVYYVHAFNNPGLVARNFFMLTQTSPENYEKVLNICLEQFRRIQEQKLTEKELENAIKMILLMDDLENQTLSSSAYNTALDELYGLGYDFRKKYKEKIRAVTADDVQRVAQKYFKNYVLATIRPSSAKDSTSATSENETRKE